jgi:hypothetical protein|tara:strand:- start:123 stop:380 length:258 start_codon:yes stop_codon:yes gene_type:complete
MPIDFRKITDGTYDLKLEGGWTLDRDFGWSPYHGMTTIWAPNGKRFSPDLHCNAGLYSATEIREAMAQQLEDCDDECTNGGCVTE